MKKITTGIVAHVDAGKTTLSEAMLYQGGAIRKLGRVDHKDAFLDTYLLERERGITIFSKQAKLQIGNMDIMLLDTPGHVDFSAEMERTLQVLDYAILVISGKDGVQGHTVTLWKLLARYKVPVFIFVNKMDLETSDKESVYENIRKKLGSGCIDFSDGFLQKEETGACSEKLIEEFLEKGCVSEESVAEAVYNREIFPCYFGSALKMSGIDNFLEGFDKYTINKEYPENFGGRIFKISRDNKGTRLTHLKLTGGSLKGKTLIGHEKIDQIRIYSGEKFKTVDTAYAGDIVTVTGLEKSFAGMGIGFEEDNSKAILRPALIYDVILKDDQDAHAVLDKLNLLEEEDPQLYVSWNDRLKSIQIQLMGQIQLEILKNLISERFGIDIEFGEARIAYKETIKKSVVGGGHFEPLRHYAEVQLLLEPGPRGSGIVIDSAVSEDVLDKNWQRLIGTHLLERVHPGVLTGAPLTDVKLTIVAGRAHNKHTEGGDFRQATYRAIRQGLMKTECQLLEPWYEFILQVPQEMVGTAIADIQRMSGTFNMPETEDGMSVIRGRGPVYEMKDYANKVNSYTHGLGHIICNVYGYDECHNEEEILLNSEYDPESDIDNPTGSVFCAHGAGYNVKWDQVDNMLHTSVQIPGITDNKREIEHERLRRESDYGDEDFSGPAFVHAPERKTVNRYIPQRIFEGEVKPRKTKPAEIVPEYLLVDGYNIIFAWDELKALAKVNIDGARDALIEMMQNYQGYKKCNLILVFDAYKIKGGQGKIENHDNITVVFTKEAETADAYIEKTSFKLKGKNHVRVATSDRLEQMIIVGNGAFKISATDFKREVESASKAISKLIEEYNLKNKREHANKIKF